jgi:predicted DNA-binding transcriptional regulator AlpA
MANKKLPTAQPVEPGAFSSDEPEFVRVPDVQKRAGIKRGICYRKIADGTFKSVLMREPGNQLGVRLIYWPSVRAYLHELMAEQKEGAGNRDSLPSSPSE